MLRRHRIQLNCNIDEASEFLRDGGLVAFPTETVYGLGADAFNAKAVAQVYSEKGRPSDNPLILHVAKKEDFQKLAFEPRDYAFALIEKFCPGPLTLVTKKNPDLPVWLGGHPDNTTETIGIRMPSHPVALEFIQKSQCIVAAPSANKAGKPSPTTIEHVREDFPNILALDGGNSTVGLESTVIDVTEKQPVILRPGVITAEEIFAVCENISYSFTAKNAPRSPGMKYKHYAPRAAMTLLSGNSENVAEYIKKINTNAKIGILVCEKTLKFLTDVNAKILLLGNDEKTIAQNLYARLREFDNTDVEIIYAEATPENGLGIAIMDRMTKAAEGRIVYV